MTHKIPRLILLIAIVCLYEINSFAQVSDDDRMQWWRDARFGMFIHWGPVSQKGTEIGWSRHDQVPIAEYDQLYKTFNPTAFSAKEWVQLAHDAGMKYIVLTAKHHDGFCLWDTKATDYNIMHTPFGRDVVRELADACRKQGVVFCTYYSILDWYQPDYNIDSRGGPGYHLPQGQQPDMDRYNRYLNTQMKELITNYGPLGIMWFDGEWEKRWTHVRGLALNDYVRSLQQDIIINNRVDKGRKGMEGVTLTDQQYAGDYDTPEQQVGKYQIDRPWETCMTIAKQWSWKPNDKVKSLDECINILVETAGGDGNLLLNVGPMPNGQIAPNQAARLREIGKWLQQYGASIYGTRGGPYPPGKWGVSTHNDRNIYLHILHPKGKKLILPALDKNIKKCHYIHGRDVKYKSTAKQLTLDLSDINRHETDNIIVIELME